VGKGSKDFCNDDDVLALCAMLGLGDPDEPVAANALRRRGNDSVCHHVCVRFYALCNFSCRGQSTPMPQFTY
jgi:hypothetical protein